LSASRVEALGDGGEAMAQEELAIRRRNEMSEKKVVPELKELLDIRMCFFLSKQK
jgi:hypothetical protein